MLPLSINFVCIFSMTDSVLCVGICAGTASGTIPAGNVLAVLNLGACEAEEFNGTLYDAFTGIDSPSTFTLEEMPQGKGLFILATWGEPVVILK